MKHILWGSWHRKSALWGMISLCLLSISLASAQESARLDRGEYADRLRAMWLGESIANWTGLNTEGQRQDRPFYSDADWGSAQGRFGKLDFILQDPWGSDDDTDIEYVYLHLMTQHNTTMLTPSQIADGWKRHINDFIWVSNAEARALMGDGVLPPATGLSVVNRESLMIDAQLTTEFFGALAPGLPHLALQMADLPIRTTASGYAAHAAQFFVVLYALAPTVDRSLSERDQVIWLVQQARQYIPDSSKTADIADFVLADFLSNPDPDNWERTRTRVYNRYHGNAEHNGFVYRVWYESSVNFAAGLIAFLYGQGDFKRTVQIGSLSGWDSDNGTATMGGLLGLMMGYDALVAQFPGVELSDRYHIYRTRDDLPDYLPDDEDAEDAFAMMAERMLPLVDGVVAAAGGTVDANLWLFPAVPAADPLSLNPLYRTQERSANNRVRRDGGHVSTAEGQEVIADGVEHNFDGHEEFDRPGYVLGKAENHIFRVEITYDQPVEAHTIRLIEGARVRGLTGARFEVRVRGLWLPLAESSVIASQALDVLVPFQIVDFTLSPRPLTITGVRLIGTTGTPGGSVTIAELDVLASP